MNIKKALFTAIFLAIVVVPSSAQIVKAQTIDASTPATSAQVDDLKSTLITLLTQMIADLQAQINTILAQQAQTVQTPVINTSTTSTPVVGNIVAPIPLKVFDLGFGETTPGSYVVSVTTNRPIDPALTLINGTTTQVSNVKNGPVGADCSVTARSSSQEQAELCNGSNVSFNVTFNRPNARFAKFTFTDQNGMTVGRTVNFNVWGTEQF